MKMEDGKVYIFDSLRKKKLILTPEEWVRQHWINFLIAHKGYPKGLFALEKGMKYNKLSKRTDLVVFDRDGMPFLLIECKAPEVQINEKTLAQAMSYNKEIKSPNIVLSNGLRHICFGYNKTKNTYEQLNDLPIIP
ncbi:type I restriction enzyme HsdR N-terminal domain-containing protein [Algoriphagus mannitolivorans]|uniref:type I restriction enzyme HsdR N-terminal domain-containing protein n=1 Tax=Algoriphagus mannitolivorans TaxID=226504 RepID=UPI001FDEB1AA|nr:type I restriction enzyme HsdR N-terminal domain-containing protein [Algoriphagus mannitolivorans]